MASFMSNNEIFISSPCYPHLSNNSGVLLVCYFLDSDSYSTWKKAMGNALLVRNRYYFGHGSLLKPTAPLFDVQA